MAEVRRVCLSAGSIGGGGIGVVMLILAETLLERGIAVDVLIAAEDGAARDLPPGARAVFLGRKASRSLWAATRYLRREQPDLIISARNYINLMMLAARLLSGLGRRTRLIWTFHTHRSSQIGGTEALRVRLADRLFRPLAGLPDALVAVSAGVAADLEATLGLAPGRITVIENPVWTGRRAALAQAPCAHRWLSGRAAGVHQGGAPVLLAMGRLTEQKDFPTLLEAFARLRSSRPDARLIVLGEGDARGALEAQIARLGLSDTVDLAGHVPDPLAYLSRANLFVLSSRWEGFSLALAEALGCGCPAVSTNCPTGPAQILDGGRLGRLVPVQDPAALAQAMMETLAAPGDATERTAAAFRYSGDTAVDRYLALAR